MSFKIWNYLINLASPVWLFIAWRRATGAVAGNVPRLACEWLAVSPLGLLRGAPGGGGQLAQRWLAPSASGAASFLLPSAPESWGHRLLDPWSQLARRSGKPASRSVLWVRDFDSSLSGQLWKVSRFHTALPTLFGAASSWTPDRVANSPSLSFVQRTVSPFG